MPIPTELSRRFIDAYNRRDRTALRELLAPDLDYVRPRGGRLRTAGEVMDQYERDWAVLEASSVEVRQMNESEDAIFAEITVHGTSGRESLEWDAAIVHEWRDGLLVRYRLYSDPPPDAVARVQPRPEGR